VDRRYFVAMDSSSLSFAYYRPLFPAVLKLALGYLASFEQKPTSLIFLLKELNDPTIPQAMKGHIFERAFYLASYFGRLHSNSPLFSTVTCKNRHGEEFSESLFPLYSNLVISDFDTPFPSMGNPGMYWSSSPSYPLVEGFIYSGNSLFGIQCTVSAPKNRRPLSTSQATHTLLENIFEFCCRKKIAFYLIYIVPEQIFNGDCTGHNVVNFNTYL
jgi:hypothetical protein